LNVEELASHLISIPTEAPPGNEEPCAAYLRDYFQDLHIEGCDVVFHRFAENRANLVVRIGSSGRAALLFSGHLDVVPAGDPSKWDTPPFEPCIRDGRLYGRGAADMKGGLAAIVKAIESVKDVKLRHGIIFVATAGEEVGFDGLKALIRDGVIKRGEATYGVVGEPTDLHVVRGHKGITIFRITFYGRSAHSSRPELGINAVEIAARYILELLSLKERLRGVQDPDLGSTTISTTIIKGGVKENMIPEMCQIVLDCRRTALHTPQDIRRELEKIGEKIKSSLDIPFDLSIEELFSGDTLNIPRDHPLVKLAEQLLGEESGIAPYVTEAPLYNKLEIPMIILGPGSVEQAHTTNEYVELKQLRKAETIYRDLIRRLCI
jgi:acetylornithine deacetylase ArgE